MKIKDRSKMLKEFVNYLFKKDDIINVQFFHDNDQSQIAFNGTSLIKEFNKALNKLRFRSLNGKTIQPWGYLFI